MVKKDYLKGGKEGTASYFLRFLTVFSLIFLVMSLIILNVMRYGVYASVEENLEHAAENVESYVSMVLERDRIPTSLTISENETKVIDGAIRKESKTLSWDFKPPKEFTANTDIIVYDETGAVLAATDDLSGLSNLTLDATKLNQILALDNFATYSGREEQYRKVTVPVILEGYPQVAYACILINTTQLKESNSRAETIVLTIMTIFWLISIGASLYLAQWSRKPILENYEREKRFVENASHELRTPLAVLQNRLESLFRKPDATILESSETIAVSLDEVRNMKMLTSNLLNLARREDGIQIQLENLGPDFFDPILENYGLMAEEAGKIFYGQNLVDRPFKSDKTLLKQVMTILFDNACKYTGPEGVIEVTSRLEDRHLLITVADNGSGISDDDKGKIFDRFYRVDKARTRQNGGFGLGLSLAKQLTEALHGKIRVRDGAVQGSVFEIRLPLVK